MKKSILFFVILISISCKEDESITSTLPIVDTFDPGQSTLLKQGTLAGVGHTVSGTVKVYGEGGKQTLVLDPFSSQNGPDLKIYLSTDEKATKYVSLGSLKSITGKQSYEISGMPDLAEYKFVLVWCQQFSVLFAKAELL
jgi:Electron transfer DM13